MPSVARRPSRPSGHGIVFLHVPKCGGTSVARAIAKTYARPVRRRNGVVPIRAQTSTAAALALDPQLDLHSAAGDTTVLQVRQTLLLHALASPGTRFVHGHVPFSRAAREGFPAFEWVTILRDPVERWLSQFFYNHYKGSSHARIDVSLDEHLEGATGAAQGHDYVKFLGGIRSKGDYRSKAAVRQAIENLDRFAVIGTLEDVPGFHDAFHKHFGRRLRIGHERRTPARPDVRSSVSQEQRDAIRTLCAPDLQVYEAALDRIQEASA